MVKREGMENLLLSYYEGETTEDETALVEEWLEASEENRRTARQVQTLGLAADMAQISSRLDVKKALEDVHRKMKQKKVNRYQVLFRGMQRAAAILFIPLMVSWSILYWDKDKEEIHMMEVRQPNDYFCRIAGWNGSRSELVVVVALSFPICR